LIITQREYISISKDLIYPFDNNLSVNLYFQIAYRLVAGMMLSLGTGFTGPGKSLKKVGFLSSPPVVLVAFYAKQPKILRHSNPDRGKTRSRHLRL